MQLGLLERVDLAAVEIEQFGIDRREPGLPARMHDDARDQVVGQHQLHFVAADDPRQLGVLAVADFGGDLVGLGRARPGR